MIECLGTNKRYAEEQSTKKIAYVGIDCHMNSLLIAVKIAREEKI
jgi:hypothetical protein